jgi:hypothetical protein
MMPDVAPGRHKNAQAVSPRIISSGREAVTHSPKN